MLKAAICVVIAVTAATAWEQMPYVDYPAEVQSGSAITYGDGRIWGIFPDPSDSFSTYFEYYDLNAPGGPTWVYPGQAYDLFFLGNTAITFQWRFGGEVLVVGNEDGDPDSPMLYSYNLVDSIWDEEAIDDFSLGAGASIAFRPASLWYGTYVAGWMYCLAGGGQEFWCYSVPGPGDVTVDGICPGQGALYADQTPTFIWPPAMSAEKYKLTISANSNMSNAVFNDSMSESSYEVTEELNNGVYYWQSASRQGSTWTASAVHSFTLEGGWTQLADVPMGVSYGGSLAYEKDYYSGKECLLALVGGEHWYYYVYFVEGDSWHEFTTAKAHGVGSAIVTHEAASETPPSWEGPWAIFAQGSDSTWYHNYPPGTWGRFNPAGEFPLSLGPGASLAYSIESDVPYLYLTVGQDGSNNPRNNFYRQQLPGFGDGEQAGPTRPTSLPARSLSDSRGITVEYQLSASARVRASVFDAVGRRVGVLDASVQQPGTHQLSWNKDGEGRRLSAGTYFVLLDMGTERARIKTTVR